MNDLDTLLSRMKDIPVDPRLREIDDAVIAGICQPATLQPSTCALALIATLSLGIGVASSVAPPQPAQAATVFPLGTPAALAPSTLLGNGE